MSKSVNPLVTDVNKAVAKLRRFYDQIGQDPEVVAALVLEAGTVEVGGITLTAERWRALRCALNLLEDGPHTWQPSQLKPALLADGTPMFATEHPDRAHYYFAGMTVTSLWNDYCPWDFYSKLLKELKQMLEEGTHRYYYGPCFAATTHE